MYHSCILTITARRPGNIVGVHSEGVEADFGRVRIMIDIEMKRQNDMFPDFALQSSGRHGADQDGAALSTHRSFSSTQLVHQEVAGGLYLTAHLEYANLCSDSFYYLSAHKHTDEQVQYVQLLT
jgi:hypothetical protein